MKKTYQFRIYPNKNQEVILNRTLSTCRHLYNDSLAERKRQAELNRLKKEFEVFPWGKPDWINYYDQKRELTATKTSFQKEVYSQVLQDVIKRLDRSFKNFFNGFGYPRFHGRNRYNSFTYPQSGFGLEDDKINLSKIGNIKIILHREIEEPIIPVETKTETGIDVGLSSLITMSNGGQIEPPEFLRESEDKLTQEQKRLSRKKKRSQIKNMMQNHHLAKSISDAGWNQLIGLTKSKAEYAGKVVELVNARNTSQNCSGCGNSVPKDLSVRVHSCPFCGLELDRDHNAAINILNRSISTVGTTGINARQGLLSRGSMQRDAQAL
ncbi:MAG: transposase [Candidatus Methanoperedenaceae archaeon]|nr:transposase [Candidatus Methanoperedenaceae archaeon]